MGLFCDPTKNLRTMRIGLQIMLYISWMKLTIDEAISESLSHIVNAHEFWVHAKTRFGVKSGHRVQRLKTELATCRQKGLDVEAYYGKLTQLWRSLADYQTAKTVEEVRKEREEDKLHQFLMGLDDSVYRGVKSSLLSRVPLPTLDEAYQLVSQDEESKLASRLFEESTNNVSFAVQTSTRSSSSSLDNRKNGSVTCDVCNRTGHVAENCFRKIGYPTWWNEKQKNKSGGPRKSDSGLTSSRAKGTDSARANIVTSNASPTTVAAGYNVSHVPLTANDRVGISGLNDAQWKSLVQLFQERDTTATHKLTGPHHEDGDWSG